MARELTPTAVMAEVEKIMSPHWRWGLLDCTTAASDVFAALHGIDPMAPVRGKYRSAVEAYRLIEAWGGMMAMGSALAHLAGLTEGISAPGEIGISKLGFCSGRWDRAAVICVSPGAWAAKTPEGFALLPNAERSWRA